MIYVNSRFLTQPITGVQRFAIELSIRLKRTLGSEIQFIAPSDILHTDLATQLDVKIVGSKKGHLWEQIDLPNYLKKQGEPILLNLCNTAPILYKKNIITVHDVAFEVFPFTYTKSFLYFYKFLIPRIIKKALKVITVSEFSKNEIIKYYKISSNKIEVIYNAVSDIFQNNNPKEKKENYFLAVASLNFRKNLPLILEAFSEFYQTNKEYQLLIIGGLDQKSFSDLDLEKYKNNPNILFKGRVSDDELVVYYQNAIAFVYPSFYEGFGIPPLEAQASGCPVILSEESCFPEIFGDTVLYCNPYMVDSLVNKFRDAIIPSINEKFVLKGYENIKKYDWDLSATQLQTIIETVK